MSKMFFIFSFSCHFQRVETFLSADINYVISSFGPSKVEDVHKCSDENPNSPLNSVASPFSCIPSPSAPGAVESKKSAVSHEFVIKQKVITNHNLQVTAKYCNRFFLKFISYLVLALCMFTTLS